MKKCAEGGPVVPVQQIWLDSMLEKVPPHLQKSVQQQKDISELFDEVKKDFKSSMKKSMGNGQTVEEMPFIEQDFTITIFSVQHVLLKPSVKGLENVVSGPPPSEPV